ncbi:hypothetical protein HC251_18690 [Iamia sp. SCSIO 61187]|uniref:hypothetical protein n=1 Tax=Iamia sp. SCSIO 61187 TaxID=2722752 RepID=UPI001C6375F3|nr:hypothetical protein [Iamia sp. SCSIO 61187]QYG94264.1 hypothetical protein HC251_18690 [Iamia sp. SCSIO 61187]
MTYPAENELTFAQRGLAWGRWTAAITTTGAGIVVVALVARVGAAAAVATAVFVVVAVGAAVWRAAAEGRRWRRALGRARSGGARSPQRARRGRSA